MARTQEALFREDADPCVPSSARSERAGRREKRKKREEDGFVKLSQGRKDSSKEWSSYDIKAKESIAKLEELSVPIELVEDLVSRLSRHVLFKNQKGCAPITRNELNQVVLEDPRLKELGRKGLASHLISIVQCKLLQSFGIEMKEIHRVRPKHASNADRKKALSGESELKVFVLRSALPEELKQYSFVRQEACSKALAFVVVNLVRLAGDSLGEDALWRYLGGLGIARGTRDHPVFGDVEEELKKMVRQRYLIREKCPMGTEEHYEYQLAENALDELPKEKMDAHYQELLKRAAIPEESEEDEAKDD